MDRKKQYHLFYKRLQVKSGLERIIFELDSGLAFLARRFHAIQPQLINFGGASYIFPDVSVSFISGSGSVRYQQSAIPTDLYSSPRRDLVRIKTETTPADLSGYSINMSAAFKNRAKTINLFYGIGETIQLEITGQEYEPIPAIYKPNYIDLALEGIYL